MSNIRITVGASLDRSTLSVFSQLAEAAKRASAQVTNANKAAAQTVDREWKQAERELARMQREKAAQTKQALRQMEQDHRAYLREKERAERDAAQRAVQQMREEMAEKKRIGEQYKRELAATRAGVNRAGGAALHMGARALRFAAGVGMGYAHGIGLETSFSGIVEKNAQLEQHAAWLSNAGFQAGAPGAAGRRVDPKQLMEESFKIGTTTGTGANEIMEGLREFVKMTGDLETGRRVMGQLATLAKATGSSIEDMANAAGNAYNQLGNMEDKAKGVDEVMRAVAGQGHLGAVEIRDLAAQMGKVAAYTQQVAKGPGGEVENMRQMGVLTQETRLVGGTSSAAQAATATMSMFQALKVGSNLEKWKALGIDPFSKTQKGMFNAPLSVNKEGQAEGFIADALRKAGTDPAKFGALFGGARGGKAPMAWQNVFLKGYGGAQGTEEQKQAAGMQAVVDEFKRLHDVIIEEEELRDSFKNAMKTQQSTAEVWNNQIQQATMEMQTQFLPVLKKLAPEMVKLLGGVAALANKLMPLAESSQDFENMQAGAKGVAIYQKKMQAQIAGGEVTEADLVKSEEGVRMQQKSITQTREDAKARGQVGAGMAFARGYATFAARIAGKAYSGDYMGAVTEAATGNVGSYAAQYKKSEQALGTLESESADIAQRHLDDLKKTNSDIRDMMRNEGIKVRLANPKAGGEGGTADEPDMDQGAATP